MTWSVSIPSYFPTTSSTRDRTRFIGSVTPDWYSGNVLDTSQREFLLHPRDGLLEAGDLLLRGGAGGLEGFEFLHTGLQGGVLLGQCRVGPLLLLHLAPEALPRLSSLRIRPGGRFLGALRLRRFLLHRFLASEGSDSEEPRRRPAAFLLQEVRSQAFRPASPFPAPWEPRVPLVSPRDRGRLSRPLPREACPVLPRRESSGFRAGSPRSVQGRRSLGSPSPCGVCSSGIGFVLV